MSKLLLLAVLVGIVRMSLTSAASSRDAAKVRRTRQTGETLTVNVPIDTHVENGVGYTDYDSTIQFVVCCVTDQSPPVQFFLISVTIN